MSSGTPPYRQYGGVTPALGFCSGAFVKRFILFMQTLETSKVVCVSKTADYKLPMFGCFGAKLCQPDFLPNKRRVTFWISLSSMFDLKRLKPCVHGIVTWSQMPVFKTVLWFLFFSSIKRIGYHCISFDIKKLQQRKQKSLILHHSASRVLISCPNSIKT